MILRHSFIYFFARGVPALVGFATIIIFTRLLSPESYGEYAIVVTGAVFVNAILYHWLSASLTRFYSVYETRIDELLSMVAKGGTVITTELSRVGRSTLEVLGLVHALTEAGIRFIAIKQNLDLDPKRKNDPASKVLITMFSLMAELERDFLSMRTRNGLALARKRGVVLGRPKGIISKSILDGKEQEIQRLIDLRIPQSSIAKILGVSRGCVVNFVRSRNLATSTKTLTRKPVKTQKPG